MEIILNPHDAEFPDRFQIGVGLGNQTADVHNFSNQPVVDFQPQVLFGTPSETVDFNLSYESVGSSISERSLQILHIAEKTLNL